MRNSLSGAEIKKSLLFFICTLDKKIKFLKITVDKRKSVWYYLNATSVADTFKRQCLYEKQKPGLKKLNN